MVRFIYNNDNSSLPISIYDSNFKPLLFSHLFLDSKSHYYNMKKYVQSNKNRLEILGKYIKHMILLNDLRFRLDHYWLTYIYLKLEKIESMQKMIAYYIINIKIELSYYNILKNEKDIQNILKNTDLFQEDNDLNKNLKEIL